MNPKDRELVDQLAIDKISLEKFRSEFSVDTQRNPSYWVEMLREASEEKDAGLVDSAIMVSDLFTPSAGLTDILCRLLLVDWHYMHENIAHFLQALKDPASIDCLYEAILKHPDINQDKCFTLGKQCIWALGDVGTAGAKEKLTALLTHESYEIRKGAEYQLQRPLYKA